MKLLAKMAVVFLLLGASFAAFVVISIRTSREFQKAKRIAVKFATSKGIGTDLVVRSVSRSWHPRGTYRLCRFAFFPTFIPKPKSDERGVIVRYTASCPTNTFEVGLVVIKKWTAGQPRDDNPAVTDTEFATPE